MTTPDLTIPTTTTSPTPKPYTIYNITLRQPLRSYTLQKRYSDFLTLHTTLTTEASAAPPSSPPPKAWFKSTVSSPELTEQRRQALEAYLKSINTCADPRWRRTEVWTRFLNLPASSVNGGGKKGPGTAASSATRQSDLFKAQIVDPTVWLDVHRDLKVQIGEARQALRRRTEASSAQMQHEAAAEAKRNLVRSGTTIAALEDGLKRMAEVGGRSQGPGQHGVQGRRGNKAEEEEKGDEYVGQKLGEGEIVRRRDLLMAARKERDGLEMQLNSFATKSASGSEADQTEPTSAGPRQKEALMNGAAVRASGPSGRRVIGGGPHKETERTRELDNQGVLQLQKQIMEEQDEDVTDMTKTIRRMKDMGIQINDELEYQNKMLEMLGDDVERVDGKIKVAKKRIGEIK